MKRRIKHNDLLPWFIRDHGTLPASYLASCKKFFKSIKQQAPSRKPSCNPDGWPSSKRLTTGKG